MIKWNDKWTSKVWTVLSKISCHNTWRPNVDAIFEEMRDHSVIGDKFSRTSVRNEMSIEQVVRGTDFYQKIWYGRLETCLRRNTIDPFITIHRMYEF